MTRTFPDGFLWGVSTSAYQVEGAVDADGRVPSIWDTYSHTPGKIDGGGTGDVACDHYRRWESDLDLIASLNANAYRFSLAWPRLFAPRERRGWDHYDRLIDGLLARGIEPVATLYHWDLPDALEQAGGGWRNRDTAERFAEHAARCFEAYGDRVGWWLTINEPWIVGLLGYLLGLHAPGYEGDLLSEVTVFHHLLLAHGRAVQAFRASGSSGRIGLAPNLMPHYPLTASEADAEAAWGSDGYVNRWFLDAIFRGSYPDDQRARYEAQAGPLDFVLDGDVATIAQPTDFLGVNYYAPRWMEAAPGDSPWPWRVVVPKGLATTGGFTDGVPQTEAGTPIVPAGLTDLLVRLHRDYGPLPLMVTENGAVFGDAPGPDGRVHDACRVEFLRAHVAAVADAIDRGVPVVGYCHWSLMDNFEWKLGYDQRFGLVHVDYETQRRTVKDSGFAYARIAAANGLVDEEEGT